MGKKVRFAMRGPWDGKRASFSLLKDEIENDGKRSQIQINDQRIIDLNRAYKAEKISLDDARQELRNIKEDIELNLNKLYSTKKPLSAFNIDILEKYISSEINSKSAAQKSTIDRDIFEARRAVELLGNNSFQTVKLNILQNILNSMPNEAANRSMLKTFRRILRYLERHEMTRLLRKKKFQEKTPPYLTEEQITQLVTNIPDEWSDKYPLLAEAIWISYDLGTRISELLALEKSDVRKSNGEIVVKISRQFVREDAATDENDRTRKTKNGVERNVAPINPKRLSGNLKSWLKSYPTYLEREPYRGALDRYIRSRCRMLFSMNPLEEAIDDDTDFFDVQSLPSIDEDRQYKAVHMLRAAHAIFWMRVTGMVEFVANQLGDTPDVVRKNYAGKVNKQLSINEAIKLRNKK